LEAARFYDIDWHESVMIVFRDTQRNTILMSAAEGMWKLHGALGYLHKLRCYGWAWIG
jgi:hypothetical protein